jgi:hypothetical protein
MSTVTIRDIITNACDGARLVNRNQPIPANIFVTAFTLMQRRLDQYSNTHLLSFLQKEVEIEEPKPRIVVGQLVVKDEYEGRVFIVDTMDGLDPLDYNTGDYIYVDPAKEAYIVVSPLPTTKAFEPAGDGHELFEAVPDVEIDDLHQILKCYVDYGGTTYDRWVDLSFVSFEDFFDRAYGNGVYSVNINSDTIQTVYTKEPVNWKKMKLIYSVPFEFDADTELNIPRQFIALFTAGLMYDLAMTYPRLGDSTIAMLKQRLDELEENVRGSSAVNKFIGRNMNYGKAMTYGEFVAGTWLM